MASHTPDRWVLINLYNNDTSVVKILSGWSGGYLDADEWRLSSAITHIKETDDHYEVSGQSGSIYTLGMRREGYTGLTSSIYATWVEQTATSDIKIKYIDPNKMNPSDWSSLGIDYIHY